MDRIARQGRCGLFMTLAPDMPTGSAVANLSVLGYDTSKCFQGRGVLEAASIGVALDDRDMAMRCNLICLDEQRRIKNHSAGHITSAEAAELIRALDRALGSDGLRFYPGVSYRHLFLGRDLDPRLQCAHSARSSQRTRGIPHDLPQAEEARQTAELLNDLTGAAILGSAGEPSCQPQAAGAGQGPGQFDLAVVARTQASNVDFPGTLRVSGGVISAVDLIRGIGVDGGWRRSRSKGRHGLYDPTTKARPAACLEAPGAGGFVYLHVEAPTKRGMRGTSNCSIRTIEDLDARLVRIVPWKDWKRRGWKRSWRSCPIIPPRSKSAFTHPRARSLRDLGPETISDAVQQYDELSCGAGGAGDH
jgi:2,3-bisphosphoglycerate-independent phosphoglycerate mutase